MQAANIIPDMLPPKVVGQVQPNIEGAEVSHSNDQTEARMVDSQMTQVPPAHSALGNQTNILDRVDLSRFQEWDPDDQAAAKKALIEFADVFAKNNLDLGCTSIVKYQIKLKEGGQPFKER